MAWVELGNAGSECSLGAERAELDGEERLGIGSALTIPMSGKALEGAASMVLLLLGSVAGSVFAGKSHPSDPLFFEVLSERIASDLYTGLFCAGAEGPGPRFGSAEAKVSAGLAVSLPNRSRILPVEAHPERNTPAINSPNPRHM
jgi:hypothetical protein